MVVKLIASSGGQYLRVGKAITSVDAILGGAAQPLTQSALAPMPTAAAVAAAAATAKIQAMETTEPPKVVVPKLGFSAVEFFPPPGNFKGYFVRSRIMPYCFIVSLHFGNSLFNFGDSILSVYVIRTRLGSILASVSTYRESFPLVFLVISWHSK